MNPENIKQILDALEKNGAVAIDGIGANAAIQAWGFLYTLGFCILGLIGMLAAFRYFRIKYYKAQDEEDASGYGVIIFGVLSVVMAIGVLMAIFAIPEKVATIKNPRAAAIRILLQR